MAAETIGPDYAAAAGELGRRVVLEARDLAPQGVMRTVARRSGVAAR